MTTKSPHYHNILAALKAEQKSIFRVPYDRHLYFAHQAYWTHTDCVIRKQMEEVFSSRDIKSLLQLESDRAAFISFGAQNLLPKSFKGQFEIDFSATRIHTLMGDNCSSLSQDLLQSNIASLVEHLQDDDKLLIGVELATRPQEIYQSYYVDVFEYFLKKHLSYLAEHLGAEIDETHFSTHLDYRPEDRKMSIHLISEMASKITIAHGDTIHLSRWEPIKVMDVQKYTHESISKTLMMAGLSILDYVSNDEGTYALYAAEKANW